MTDSINSTIRENNGAAQIYLPVKFAQDSCFPFDLGDEVSIRIDDDQLVISPTGDTE